MNVIPRRLTKNVVQSLTVDRVVAIMGPRQAGKTTLVRHLLEIGKPVQYYNLKDPTTRRSLQTNARKEFLYYQDHLIILDEVQMMPMLLELIQLQVDEFPDVKGQFLILGSKHLLLNRRIKESLAGRVALHTLYPLSLHEKINIHQKTLLELLFTSSGINEAESILTDYFLPTDMSNTLKDGLIDQNLFGGYPEFLSRPHPDDRKQWLKNYHQTYLETDLRELVDLRSPESFERFEQHFTSRVGNLLNISELARDCSLTADTIRRFLGYYRQLFITWQALPYHADINKRMMKMPKWYFIDTGLFRSVSNDFRPESGHFFENTILTEMLKEIYLLTGREDQFFARTSTGVEIDVVYQNRQRNFSFLGEIKQTESIRKADIRHLKKFTLFIPDSIGLLINASNTIEKLSERIWNVPAHWLLA